MIPGEIETLDGDIEINVNRDVLTVIVCNAGDRPIQVGSHYHFYETNEALEFDREKTKGFRLNVAAGTAIRFEPGQRRTVELVAIDGVRKIFGFRGLVMGEVACLIKSIGALTLRCLAQLLVTVYV